MVMYLALMWNHLDRAQATTANRMLTTLRQYRPGWRTAVNDPGMFVAFRPPVSHEAFEAYPLTRGGGVVLGRLFERDYAESDSKLDGPPRHVNFDEKISAKLIADEGNTLRDCYWGSYVAFLNDGGAGTRHVLRDPSGQIPCQLASIEGISAYFVRLIDFEVIWRRPLRINSRYFIGRAVQGVNFSMETAYDGISTVLPGERITRTITGTRRSFYWNMVELANADKAMTLRDAESATRRLTRSCVHAWASCFQSIALQLSGGVDSSIVAACLATCPTRPEILTVNTHLDVETTDERKFARQVAALHGFELLEHHGADVGRIDLSTRKDPTVTPQDVDVGMSDWTDLCSLLHARGYSVQFRGDAGDEIFYKDGLLPDAVDFCFYHGIKPAIWKIAMNDAIIGRTSVWEVLRQSLLYGVLRRSHGPHEWFDIRRRATHPIFCDAARSEALELTNFWHPLYRNAADCAPAKLFQSYSLLRYMMCTYTAPPTPARLVFVRPLVSQPLLDFSLRSPLHVLRAGARDRARARGAFADCVPSSILNRRYKGLFTTPTQRWMREVLGDARELLLDGYLTRERIVDRRVLEVSLAKEDPSDYILSGVLKSCLDCEVWVRDTLARESDAREPISSEA